MDIFIYADLDLEGFVFAEEGEEEISQFLGYWF